MNIQSKTQKKLMHIFLDLDRPGGGGGVPEVLIPIVQFSYLENPKCPPKERVVLTKIINTIDS